MLPLPLPILREHTRMCTLTKSSFIRKILEDENHVAALKFTSGAELMVNGCHSCRAM